MINLEGRVMKRVRPIFSSSPTARTRLTLARCDSLVTKLHGIFSARNSKQL
jgi:hypothetical protein